MSSSIYNEINNKIDDFQEIKKTISEEYKQKQGVFVTLTIFTTNQQRRMNLRRFYDNKQTCFKA